MELLTQELAKTICDKIFPEETKTLFEITLADNSKIELYKQFWKYFKNRPLKYNLEETIIEAARIYEFTKQDVIKYKLAKEKIDLINTPESYFDTTINLYDSSGDSGGVDSKESLIKGDTKSLSIDRKDSANKNINKAIARGGNSSFNEDFVEIEENWKNKDKNFNNLITGAELNINLSNENPLDVSKATITIQQPREEGEIAPTIPKPTKPEEDELLYNSPEVAYTNITLSKALNSSETNSLNFSKSLHSSSKSMEAKNKNLNTNVWKKAGKVMNSKFSYGEKTFIALNYYISNFKESFFSSFNPLFFEVWGGYGKHSF